MHKLIAGIALSILSTVAHAQWILVTNDDVGTKYFADPTTKKRSGDVTKMWVLMDKHQATASGQSLKILNEFHCRNEQSRVTAAIPYSGKMGSGDAGAIVNIPNAAWEPFPPDSVKQELFNYACK